MESYCHGTFSSVSCDWTAQEKSAAATAHAAAFVLSMCASGSLIGGIATRFSFIGIKFNLLIEAAVGALLGSLVHVALFLGVVARSSDAPFPLWLSMLFWTLPFALTMRVQVVCFLSILVPLSSKLNQSPIPKIRFFSILFLILSLAVPVSMAAVSHFYQLGYSIYGIFAAGYGIFATVASFLAAKTFALISSHLKALPNQDRQDKLQTFRRWSVGSIVLNSVWVISLAARMIVSVSSSSSPSAIAWTLWLCCDVAWIVAANAMIATLAQREDITDNTIEAFKPNAVVFMSEAQNGVARSVFLDTFSEDEVRLSLAAEQPIFLHIPKSFKELTSLPHPSNEIHNRINAFIMAMIHFPLAILLLNFANWPWYGIIPLSSQFLRLCFAYRLDPQGWMSIYIAKLFDPVWVPAAPKRFAAAISVVLQSVALGLALSGYKQVSSWLLAAHIVLSYNQMLGWCLGCVVFVLLAKIGLVPEEVCKRCMQRFVNSSSRGDSHTASTHLQGTGSRSTGSSNKASS